MARVSTFTRLRSALAPVIRPVLEHVGPVRRLALALLVRRHPDEIELDGLRFEVHRADFGVTLELASTGDYEPATRRACRDALGPGMTFIDIGAHVGLFALPAAGIVGPTGRVIAFEPDPDNRALLERNIVRNQIASIEVVAAAVADEDGEVDLQRSAWNTGDHCIGRARSGRQSIRVPVVRLDTWCSAHGLVPDVIKMDVQGAEAKVIAGLAEILAGDRPLQVLMEFSPSMLRAMGARPRGVLDSLVAAGLSMHLIDEAAGTQRPVDVDAVLSACPDRGYVNLRCVRESRP